MTVAVHAYPWDVLGDPHFADRVIQAGIGEVTLAAAYHSVRAATPMHPRHQVIHARHGALYRPVRDEAWRGRRLRPAEAPWCPGDAFADATEILLAAGLRVSAWIVLTHNSRLGQMHPDIAVVNCYGDSYPYALCPASAEVRAYAAALTGAVLVGVPVTGVSLEACGQLGVVHQDHHDKTAGAWPASAQRALGVCCCGACRSQWSRHGLDPGRVTAALRDTVRGGELPAEIAEPVLAARHAAADLLRREVISAVRAHSPHTAITLHAHPDPWALGSSPGLTGSILDGVDEILVPAWDTGPDTAAVVKQATRIAGTVPVAAYLTVLPPAEPAGLLDHARRLRAAGATRLSLYHAGLAGVGRQPLLGRLAAV